MNWEREVRKFEADFDYAGEDHWKRTEDLKARIAQFRTRNWERGLSLSLLNSIVKWKLRGQRGRTEKFRKSLTSAMVERVTACAFSVHHKDQDVRALVQGSVLSSLPGIGMGVATAILALTFP